MERVIKLFDLQWFMGSLYFSTFENKQNLFLSKVEKDLKTDFLKTLTWGEIFTLYDHYHSSTVDFVFISSYLSEHPEIQSVNDIERLIKLTNTMYRKSKESTNTEIFLEKKFNRALRGLSMNQLIDYYHSMSSDSKFKERVLNSIQYWVHRKFDELSAPEIKRLANMKITTLNVALKGKLGLN